VVTGIGTALTWTTPTGFDPVLLLVVFGYAASFNVGRIPTTTGLA